MLPFVICGILASAKMATNAPTIAYTFVTSRAVASRIGGLTAARVVLELQLLFQSRCQTGQLLAFVKKVAQSKFLSHVRRVPGQRRLWAFLLWRILFRPPWLCGLALTPKGFWASNRRTGLSLLPAAGLWRQLN